jgi:hypothetical protein
MGGRRGAYGFFLRGELMERDHMKNLGVDGKIILKMDPQEVGWEGVDWIALGQNKDRGQAFVNAVMNHRVP